MPTYEEQIEQNDLIRQALTDYLEILDAENLSDLDVVELEGF